MVTAELAVGLPAVVLVLALCLGALGLLSQQMSCTDAAAVGARAAARGETDAAALNEARRVAPAGSAVTITRSATQVTVTVTAPVGPGELAGLRARASTSALIEQGVEEPP